MIDDPLTADELTQLARTDLGRRAANEIHRMRDSEPSALAIIIGLILVIALAVSALVIALPRSTNCPPDAAAP